MTHALACLYPWWPRALCQYSTLPSQQFSFSTVSITSATNAFHKPSVTWPTPQQDAPLQRPACVKHFRACRLQTLNLEQTRMRQQRMAATDNKVHISYTKQLVPATWQLHLEQNPSSSLAAVLLHSRLERAPRGPLRRLDARMRPRLA